MLAGRLGLETARVPHADRHGLLWLGHGRLSAEDGTLHWITSGGGDLAAGAYDIPYQTISCILLQPGASITHDALRLTSRHGTGIVIVGQDGVRLYGAMPFGPDESQLARRQAIWWADADLRVAIARRMYALRLAEILPSTDINTLRGIEGARAKVMYRRIAEQHGVEWSGRRFNRQNPDEADWNNQAINHASTALKAAAQVATSVVGALPQLGFIHEDSGIAFCLDIADLFRDAVTLPVAFAAVAAMQQNPKLNIEREVRLRAGKVLRQRHVIADMIDKIKLLLRADTLDPHRPAPEEELLGSTGEAVTTMASVESHEPEE